MKLSSDFAHRMGSKRIRLVDASGNPVRRKEVALKQTNHKFLFGSGIFDAIQVTNKSASADRLALLEEKRIARPEDNRPGVGPNRQEVSFVSADRSQRDGAGLTHLISGFDAGCA